MLLMKFMGARCFSAVSPRQKKKKYLKAATIIKSQGGIERQNVIAEALFLLERRLKIPHAWLTALSQPAAGTRNTGHLLHCVTALQLFLSSFQSHKLSSSSRC